MLELSDGIVSKEKEKKLYEMHDKVEEMFEKSISTAKNLVKTAIPAIINYAILSWIYLSLLEIYGFEKALILAIVGLTLVASRINKR